MKFEVEGVVIDINVREKGAKRCSKEKTMHFMNRLAILYSESAELDRVKFAEHPERTYYGGEHGTIRQSVTASQQIHDQLDTLGFYNNL